MPAMSVFSRGGQKQSRPTHAPESDIRPLSPDVVAAVTMWIFENVQLRSLIKVVVDVGEEMGQCS